MCGLRKWVPTLAGYQQLPIEEASSTKNITLRTGEDRGQLVCLYRRWDSYFGTWLNLKNMNLNVKSQTPKSL